VSGVPDALTQALAGRYVIEHELGQGGMASVYQARAPGRAEPVAIKVMNPNLADALDSKRFVREMGVAASLDHPLIVPLIDSGHAGAALFYVMPFVSGESLYDRLQREGRLPVPDAIGIARDVATALVYAHERGVMHRDVKPENILLARGRALIADFGLARAIGAADYTKLTATGVIVGTLYYMSPEQLREEPDLDQRTDVYSLGCMLYEMLSGELPYTGRTLTEVASRILRGPIPSVRRLRPEVPASVDEAIRHALAKVRADRFTTMSELLAALPS
jgi:serine/threonine-protein kinase